jgi:hypothetical protein
MKSERSLARNSVLAGASPGEWTAVKLPVKRIIVGPADGADERSRALSRRSQ